MSEVVPKKKKSVSSKPEKSQTGSVKSKKDKPEIVME